MYREPFQWIWSYFQVEPFKIGKTYTRYDCHCEFQWVTNQQDLLSTVSDVRRLQHWSADNIQVIGWNNICDVEVYTTFERYMWISPQMSVCKCSNGVVTCAVYLEVTQQDVLEFYPPVLFQLQQINILGVCIIKHVSCVISHWFQHEQRQSGCHVNFGWADIIDFLSWQ